MQLVAPADDARGGRRGCEKSAGEGGTVGAGMFLVRKTSGMPPAVRERHAGGGRAPPADATGGQGRIRVATCNPPAGPRGAWSRKQAQLHCLAPPWAPLAARPPLASRRRVATAIYERRVPEHSVLWQCVTEHLSTFLAKAAEVERTLPRFVIKELEGFLHCGLLEPGTTVTY